MSDTAPSTPRIVPGAPPPSKSQKKKRRAKAGGKPEDSPAAGSVSIPDTTSASLTDTAPAPADIAAGSVAEELIAHPSVNGDVEHSTPGASHSSIDHKSSPVVEIIHKRFKATAKKIVCHDF
jgi:hypothetical protein